MGSFYANGREQGPNRRRNTNHQSGGACLKLECLEERQLLSGVWRPTSTDLADHRHGPMANLGPADDQRVPGLAIRRPEHGRSWRPVPRSLVQECLIFGVSPRAGDRLRRFKKPLQNLGMQITDTAAAYGVVDGWMPISQLPTAAQSAQTSQRIAPTSRPVTTGSREQRGEPLDLRQRRQLGTAASRVPACRRRPVRQLQSPGRLRRLDVRPATCRESRDQRDPGGPDRRRGRGPGDAENIYHIAPGAALSFATGFGGVRVIRPTTSWPWPTPAPRSSWTTSAIPTSRSSSPASSPRPSTRSRPRAFRTSARPPTTPTTATCRTSAGPTAPSPASAPAGT